MKPSLRTLLGAAALLALALPAQAQEISLRAVSFLPKNHPVMAMNQVWVDDINAALAGKVKVNYVGGPEVIPGLQQAEAVSKGVIDIAFNPTAYYQSLLPEVSAFILSRKTPAQEREANGFYDYMVKRHETIGLRYIGRTQMSPFYIWTKDKPAAIDGLKGMKLRTAALYDRFMNGLGAVPVTIPEGEVYTALEGGTVSGFGWPVFGARQRGWIKIVRHVIDIPFFGSSNVVAIMNNDKWKTLPADVQKKIIDVTAAFEPKVVKHFADAEKEEWAELDKAGVIRFRFSDAENKKYLDTTYEVELQNLSTKVPDQMATLRKLTGN